jgi:hypothetical protein
MMSGWVELKNIKKELLYTKINYTVDINIGSSENLSFSISESEQNVSYFGIREGFNPYIPRLRKTATIQISVRIELDTENHNSNVWTTSLLDSAVISMPAPRSCLQRLNRLQQLSH